ncbi:MAG: class I SAM-dependent methyltransferase [Elusimicrobia bacterium]|nr:class I SAM-dependent methyltransferase [Elusimicrobiota bacterium]
MSSVTNRHSPPGTTREIRQTLRQLYTKAPWKDSLYIQGRAWLIDFETIDLMIAENSRILDLACGYGLLANYISLSQPGRTVHGVDLSPRRIKIARQTIQDRARISFSMGDITQFTPSDYDAITFIDSLHYFDLPTQRMILQRCFESLSPQGKLILREASKKPSWKHALNYAHEWIMTHSHFTPTRDKKIQLNFLNGAQWEALLRSVGFEAVKTIPPRHWAPYTDTFYVGYKKSPPYA